MSLLRCLYLYARKIMGIMYFVSVLSLTVKIDPIDFIVRNKCLIKFLLQNTHEYIKNVQYRTRKFSSEQKCN